ncbi:hypothetical protein E2C01_093738 [Portunus trituberculatus]|uniref:Uncharacterized protein n=1 Tax=Portunus trituberculatus TaxID=210409 RepID=A0A5B7JNH8_PORTR|nr:hypothetical protein [Portunus trituberculatus]
MNQVTSATLALTCLAPTCTERLSSEPVLSTLTTGTGGHHNCSYGLYHCFQTFLSEYHCGVWFSPRAPPGSRQLSSSDYHFTDRMNTQINKQRGAQLSLIRGMHLCPPPPADPHHIILCEPIILFSEK